MFGKHYFTIILHMKGFSVSNFVKKINKRNVHMSIAKIVKVTVDAIKQNANRHQTKLIFAYRLSLLYIHPPTSPRFTY